MNYDSSEETNESSEPSDDYNNEDKQAKDTQNPDSSPTGEQNNLDPKNDQLDPLSSAFQVSSDADQITNLEL